jgi:serine/threonine protein phosphatase PrpC
MTSCACHYPLIPGSLREPAAGAAVTVAVLQGDVLSVGGVGDCRAILDTGVDTIPLTIDHRVNDDAREFRRLEEGGKPPPTFLHTFTCLLSGHACLEFRRLEEGGDPPSHLLQAAFACELAGFMQPDIVQCPCFHHL